MSENTKIEWATHTFNGWEGCQPVGPGCDHCYAEARNARFGGGVAVNWGPGAHRRRTSVANWRKLLAWNANHDAFFADHGHRQRVFCSSLADVFDNAVDPQWRADLFELIESTPNLDWLLLTKRIGNVLSQLKQAGMHCASTDRTNLAFWIMNWFDGHPPANVWIGATICNQAEADRDIPKLLAVPAAKRFLSMEPLLGAVDLTYHLWGRATPCADYPKDIDCDCGFMPRNEMPDEPQISWVIVGGESGLNARPMHPDWARSLRDQCETAGVPFLFKQWGEWVSACDSAFGTAKGRIEHIRSDGTLWGDDLPLDENSDVVTVVRVGKKAAGRLLDGREWNGVPA